MPKPSLAFDQNHTEWATVLKTFTEDGWVDYAALKVSRAGLDSYSKEVGEVSKEAYEAWSKEEKIAFWINAYNAFTVQTIVDHYPTKSIKKIPNVWGEKRFLVLGEKRSLNQIEHDILRKEFKEPRIHFALVCASIGCPALKDSPYTGKDLNSQLDSQVRDFLSDKSKAVYDEKTGTLQLSPIFKWYGEDFKEFGGVLGFISLKAKHYLPNEMEGKITPKTKISWLGYNWDLNETKFPEKT
jgi:hypothetical protein